MTAALQLPISPKWKVSQRVKAVSFLYFLCSHGVVLKRWEKGAEVKYSIAFGFHQPLLHAFPSMFLLDISACFHGSQGVHRNTFPT